MRKCGAMWWTILASAVSIAVATACSDPMGETCETTEDCYEQQVCDDGQCRADLDAGNGISENEQQSDAGDTDTVDLDADDADTDDVEEIELDADDADVEAGDTGELDVEENDVDESDVDDTDASVSDVEQSDVADTATDAGESDVDDGEECVAEFPCDDNVNDPSLYEMTGLIIEPVDEEHDEFACPTSAESGEFVDQTPEPLEVRSCPDEEQRFRVNVRPCTDQVFVAEVELTPLNEACPLTDWKEVWFATTGFPECESAGEANCYISESPEHGGHRWQVNFAEDSSPITTAIRFAVTAESGASFPYEVRVDFENGGG